MNESTPEELKIADDFLTWLDEVSEATDKDLEEKLFNGPFAKPSDQTLTESMMILSSGEK